MKHLTAGDKVVTNQEITIIQGLGRSTIPAGTRGIVQFILASDAAMVSFDKYDGKYFVKAEEVDLIKG